MKNQINLAIQVLPRSSTKGTYELVDVAIELIQKSLSRYKFNNVIVKKNLSKRELERFFSIDLRDLVRTNHVNSLFICDQLFYSNQEDGSFPSTLIFAEAFFSQSSKSSSKRKSSLFTRVPFSFLM